MATEVVGETKSEAVDEANFVEDEKVLVFHGPLLYEAKILDIKKEGEDEGPRFKVHYLGWKDRWDEEVPKSRVRKFNEESVQLKETLLAHLASGRKRDRADANAMSLGGAAGGSGNRKRKQHTDMDGENNAGAGQSNGAAQTAAGSLIVLPSGLKKQLIDDWEFITKEQKLVPLPRDPTVSAILSAWLQSKSRRGIADRASREVADGLREYFDAALGTMLLYKFERSQYNHYAHSGKNELKPSKLYGAEHLLRLIVKLPTLLEKAKVEQSKLNSIAEKVNEIAKFLHKNGRIVFLPEYESADESYIADMISSH
mmetsp:Transcript_1364/g.4093  ORF Transcript_1364/g.4093 Transcript_1364/m.4093 type:complete len:313 (-) Transcript_1364:1457-2395(-)